MKRLLKQVLPKREKNKNPPYIHNFYKIVFYLSCIIPLDCSMNVMKYVPRCMICKEFFFENKHEKCRCISKRGHCFICKKYKISGEEKRSFVSYNNYIDKKGKIKLKMFLKNHQRCRGLCQLDLIYKFESWMFSSSETEVAFYKKKTGLSKFRKCIDGLKFSEDVVWVNNGKIKISGTDVFFPSLYIKTMVTIGVRLIDRDDSHAIFRFKDWITFSKFLNFLKKNKVKFTDVAFLDKTKKRKNICLNNKRFLIERKKKKFREEGCLEKDFEHLFCFGKLCSFIYQSINSKAHEDSKFYRLLLFWKRELLEIMKNNEMTKNLKFPITSNFNENVTILCLYMFGTLFVFTEYGVLCVRISIGKEEMKGRSIFTNRWIEKRSSSENEKLILSIYVETICKSIIRFNKAYKYNSKSDNRVCKIGNCFTFIDTVCKDSLSCDSYPLTEKEHHITLKIILKVISNKGYFSSDDFGISTKINDFKEHFQFDKDYLYFRNELELKNFINRISEICLDPGCRWWVEQIVWRVYEFLYSVYNVRE